MTVRPLPGLLLAVAVLHVAGCERPEPDIDPASVERVVTTLSADEMLGRAAFTPGIERAADFIRDEFASIGLEALDGLDGYLQRFTVHRLEVESRTVILNGVEIPSERSFAWTEAPVVHWTTGDSVEIVVIGPGESPGRRIYEISTSDRDALLLMSTDHEAFFRRWAADWSVPVFSLDPPSGATLVCVLTDEPHVTSYDVRVTAPVVELPLANVVGVIAGRRGDEIVLFGGHYDGYGILDPVDGDSIANSANDCASGTTAMIELARYFKVRGRPERTLIFAAFTAHERMPYLGAEYLSRQLDPEEIVAMFSLANMGRVSDRGPGMALVTGYERSDFGAILQHAVEGTPYAFYPDPYEGRHLFRRSDNVPFARFGVPAHGISTGGAQQDRHTVSDEVETLDLTNMTNVIRAIALGAAVIVSGEATPTRIDPPLSRN